MRSTKPSSTSAHKIAVRLSVLVLGLLVSIGGPAGASGKTASSGTPKPTTGCAKFVSLSATPTAAAKFYVTGTVTSCGTAVSNYTTRVTDTTTHSNAACAISADNYKWHSSIAPGETLMFWQIGGSGMCLTDTYNLKVEVIENNVVLASALTTWSPPV
jgi:hypothetical protein